MVLKLQKPRQFDLGHCFIRLRDGEKAIVDPEDYDLLNQFKWFLQRSHYCSYVVTKRVRDGKVFYLRMHRMIMNTPPGMDCHHINSNTSDNRKSNLQNVTREEHAFL
jgi:hypothetical protein